MKAFNFPFLFFDHRSSKIQIIFSIFLVNPCDTPKQGGCKKAFCIKEIGTKYHCKCSKGFMLDKDNKTCKPSKFLNFLSFV